MSTLSMTRKTAATLATAAAMNINMDELEAQINGNLDADNLADDAVTAAKLNSDVVRSNYGLVQHTDGSLYVDLSDTNPSLELTDGGLRAKVYGMINRTANGLTFGRSGDVILSSCADTPDGWTDVSATYADKFIRISATALSAGGSDTHTHTFTLSAANIPAHTHSVAGVVNESAGSSIGMAWTGTARSITSGSTGSASQATTDSGSTVPAYVTLKMYQKS